MRPSSPKFHPEINFGFRDGNIALTKLKSSNVSNICANVPFDKAYFLVDLIQIFEQIVNLAINLSNTWPPGKVLGQKLVGKFDENVYCPGTIPCTYGLIEIEPVICRIVTNKLPLVLIIPETSSKLLSQQVLIVGTEAVFILLPLENTVIDPILFRPALFAK